MYVYLNVIPPELQQCGESALHLAEELVEEAQLSHTIPIQHGAQSWNKTNDTIIAYYVMSIWKMLQHFSNFTLTTLNSQISKGMDV